MVGQSTYPYGKLPKIQTFPYGTSRSVYSLLQICWDICCRSADNLQIIYRLSTDHLQNVCRMSAEYLQNVCRSSAELICSTSADLQTCCRRRYDKNSMKLHQSNTVYLIQNNSCTALLQIPKLLYIFPQY